MEYKFTKENFSEEVLKSDVPVLVDFYADWCGPCKMVGPLVAQIADEHDDVAVVKVNVDDEMERAEKFGVASIPTIILFKDGKETKKNIGAMSKAQLEEFISE